MKRNNKGSEAARAATRETDLRRLSKIIARNPGREEVWLGTLVGDGSVRQASFGLRHSRSPRYL